MPEPIIRVAGRSEEGAVITTVALEEQMRFAMREGGRTIGAGIVTAVR